ncbi:MAG: DMT family transporter [Paracoccaceae bacterium]|nr:DMT family transporter [Paracoccaceae bacterium]
MIERRFAPYLLLLMLGAGWGLTQPMTKIAVSTGFRPFGLIVWQLTISALVLGGLMLATGRRPPQTLRGWRMCAVIALVGTVIPNSASYLAARHLPSGILSIMLSMVPMLAFPLALAMGNDRFAPLRLLGLVCGLGGVALIALPGSSLPQPGMAAWFPVALIGPAFYAVEANVVATWGTGGNDPIQLLFGASLVGLVFAVPMALASGQWIDPSPPWGAPVHALMVSATVSPLVYAGYVWLIGKAGSVFAAQVSYLVTGTGVLWAMAILGERYSGWVWAAMALMLAGLALVRPREAEPPAGACETARPGGPLA